MLRSVSAIAPIRCTREETEVALADVADALLITSALMLTVGLLACAEPARRALRIHPTDALREA